MKRSYKVVIILVLLAAALAAMIIHAVRSTPYRSHYNTVACVTSNTSGSAHITFSKLSGTVVFKLKSKNPGERLVYVGSLDSGSAAAFYDNGAGKTELFSVSDESPADGSVPLEPGTVYVVLETDGDCLEGSFKFEIESGN